MGGDWLYNFVRESNRIEGIHRVPSEKELAAHANLLGLRKISVGELETFVDAVQPGNVLRVRSGLNVRVGDYIAPAGGPLVRQRLEELLAFLATATPRANHVAYETLHPFTDGNGRSGRALWLWQHLNLPGGTPERAKALGFLHTYYYETLAESRPTARPDEEA